MKKLSYMERVYHNLNTAFSINYMILQNLDRIMKLRNGSGVMTRDDIFGSKSSAEYHYDNYFKDFAEIRLEYFDEIRRFFDAETYFRSFSINSQYLIEEYNKFFGKNKKTSDIFSERNVKDWEIFNQIFDEINDCQSKPSFDVLKMQCAFAQFLIFYEDYKNWLSAYEIFEVLENDITSYGSKSLYHGITHNEDVFVLDFDDYHEYFEVMTKFLSNYNKTKKKKKSKEDEEQDVYKVSLDAITDFYNKIEDRFGYANSHLMEIGSLWSKFNYYFSHMSDGDFEVNQVYVHKNEILSLLSALASFPELHEIADKISLKFLGKNVEFSQNKTKENT